MACRVCLCLQTAFAFHVLFLRAQLSFNLRTIQGTLPNFARVCFYQNTSS